MTNQDTKPAPEGLKDALPTLNEGKDALTSLNEGKASFSPAVGRLRVAGGFLRTRLPLVLVVAAIVLAGLGAWFTVQANGLRSTGSATNRALVDPAATAEVTSAVSTGLNKIFSYSFDRTEITEKAAAEVLRPPALDAYHQLFGQVRTLAPQQKLVLTTRVIGSGVQSLSQDDATLLVFLDQSATRADNNTTSLAASQLSITAHREGSTWVITGLEPR